MNHHHSKLPPPPPISITNTTSIKFLCSYGGMIIPRYPDGKLRYHGGETRVLTVDRLISFSEFTIKLGDICGTRVSHVRCQLPSEGVDALISITCDEDLFNLIEEYNQSTNRKIRTFLSMPKKPYSTLSSSSSSSSSSSNSYAATVGPMSTSKPPRCHHRKSPPVGYPVKKIMHTAHRPHYHCGHANHSFVYMHGS